MYRRLVYVGKDGETFFQYTVLEEASRERFIYAYKEQSGYSTVDFVKRAILYFGYAPQIIQTDNGSEFCNTKNTKRIHIFDSFCAENHIFHKQIRPKTPWHNGKVERSHRSDQECFYNHLRSIPSQPQIQQRQIVLLNVSNRQRFQIYQPFLQLQERYLDFV